MVTRSVSSGATAQSLPYSSRWIVAPWLDLVLFVGTPLLIIPAFLAAQARWRIEELSLFVASFGAIGHHLPGMLRAYGDRALFQRFRWRFCLAPVLLEASAIEALRTTAVSLTGVVTAAFLLHSAWMWHRGRPVSSVKLLLMATSIGFFWYTNVFVSNLLAGIALFEVFHDVQYLSIVWIYNLNRVQKDPGVGAFTRFLFRRSGALVGVYVGLVVAYGSLNLVSTAMSTGLLRRTLTGLLAASALLHFYYDGFIWKVRERATRQSLGLSGGTPDQALAVRPAWLLHGAKWSLFIVPVLV